MNDTSDFLRNILDGATPKTSPSTRIRALAWARVSTDMQEERGCSIPEQQRQIREYAVKHGIEIVEEYHEAASAFTHEGKRVEFHKMLRQATEDSTIDTILIHDFSRFSRDSVRAKQLLRELRDKGVTVVSLNDPNIDPESVAGVYMEAITFAKNEAYSREVAFHTRKGCRANIRTRDPETSWCYKNGGQPLWGYRIRTVDLGRGKSNRDLRKAIWELDDTVVAGQPTREFVKNCLNFAAEGASLDELRDICNNNGVPGRRNPFWSTSTWHSLLELHALLQYCGYGVWNVHRKNGTKRPVGEWEIVPNAHPALITEDVARRIHEIRLQRRSFNKSHKHELARSERSPYLLSGGIFKCSRCGSNMVGKKSRGHEYYVCGSSKYRRGMGCGDGVYLPKQDLEGDVVAGIQTLLTKLMDTPRLVQKVNREFRRLAASGTQDDPAVGQRQKTLEVKIANLVRSLEDGVLAAEAVNGRLRELEKEKDELSRRVKPATVTCQIDVERIRAYLKDLKKALAKGTPAQIKRYIGECVDRMTLDPDDVKVVIEKRTPGIVSPALSHQMVAGAGFEPATFGL